MTDEYPNRNPIPKQGKGGAGGEGTGLMEDFKKRWEKLSDDDIERIAGQRNQLIETLMERYARTREVAEREVADFYEGLPKKAKDEDGAV